MPIRTILRVFSAIAGVGIAIVCIFWLKDNCFTSPVDRWLNQAKWELSTRTVCADEPCPEAVKCLDKASEVWTPKDGLEKRLNVLAWRGELLNLDGKFEKAVDDYTQAIEIDPQEFQFYRGRAIALCSLEKTDEAIADFTKALELSGYPKTVVLAKSKHKFISARYTNQTYYDRASIYYQKKDFERAIQDLIAIINMEPDVMKSEPPTGYDGLVGAAYHLRGKIYNRSGQYDKAIKDFSKCAAFVVSVYTDIYRERGYAYVQTKQYQKAVDDFAKANAKESYSPFNWFNFHERAIAYAGLGQNDKAQLDSNEAEKLKGWVSGPGKKDGLKNMPPD